MSRKRSSKFKEMLPKRKKEAKAEAPWRRLSRNRTDGVRGRVCFRDLSHSLVSRGQCCLPSRLVAAYINKATIRQSLDTRRLNEHRLANRWRVMPARPRGKCARPAAGFAPRIHRTVNAFRGSAPPALSPRCWFNFKFPCVDARRMFLSFSKLAYSMDIGFSVGVGYGCRALTGLVGYSAFRNLRYFHTYGVIFFEGLDFR